MQNFKNKLYHFETPPPEGIWDEIAEELQNEKVIQMHGHRKSKFLFYGATAAASVIIIFLGSIFFNKSKDLIPTAKVQTKTDRLLAKKIKDSITLNQKILESIIHNPEKKEVAQKASKNDHKKYLTIAGPEGQPVKISPKVATLIISADHEFPPKPVWSNKINKWQKIMLSSTASPTSANLIDLMKLVSKSDDLE
jgi:hypothetical protein